MAASKEMAPHDGGGGGCRPDTELSLLHMSDCVLHMVLSNLDAYDLYCLSRINQRFQYLMKARSLWRRVDLLEHPLCSHKFLYFYEYLSSGTAALLARGLHRVYEMCGAPLLQSVFAKCSSLAVLALEEQRIDSDQILLRDFPSTLQELSLRRTRIGKRQEFLKNIGDTLVNLHTLILDECVWVREHSLMPISKLPSLVNLSLYGCPNLFDSIAYMSVTTRFGFPKLQRVDVRRCENGDEFLKSFRYVNSLREVYMEASSRVVSADKSRATPQSFFSMINELYPAGMDPPITIFSRISIFKQWKERMRQLRRNRQVDRGERPEAATTAEAAPGRVLDCVAECVGCSVQNCIERKAPHHGGPRTLPEPVPGTSSSEPPPMSEANDSDDDDVRDFDFIQNAVTDTGVTVFCSAAGGEVEPAAAAEEQAARSALLPPVYGECKCAVGYPDGVTRFEDVDKPGCSGLQRRAARSSDDDATANGTADEDAADADDEDNDDDDDAGGHGRKGPGGHGRNGRGGHGRNGPGGGGGRGGGVCNARRYASPLLGNRLGSGFAVRPAPTAAAPPAAATTAAATATAGKHESDGDEADDEGSGEPTESECEHGGVLAPASRASSDGDSDRGAAKRAAAPRSHPDESAQKTMRVKVVAPGGVADGDRRDHDADGVQESVVSLDAGERVNMVLRNWNADAPLAIQVDGPEAANVVLQVQGRAVPPPPPGPRPDSPRPDSPRPGSTRPRPLGDLTLHINSRPIALDASNGNDAGNGNDRGDGGNGAGDGVEGAARGAPQLGALQQRFPMPGGASLDVSVPAPGQRPARGMVPAPGPRLAPGRCMRHGQLRVPWQAGGEAARVYVYRPAHVYRAGAPVDDLLLFRAEEEGGAAAGAALPPPLPDPNYSRIRVLCLRGYERVTDATLHVLNERALSLRVLDVSGTSVTADTVRWFRRSNPHVRVVHESVCACAPRRYAHTD